MHELNYSKISIRFIFLTALLGVLPTAYSQPSVLELKVLQTRVFDVNPEKFISGVKEMCANYGATLIGGQGTAFLAQGAVRCIGMKGKYQHINKLILEGNKDNDLGLVVRFRIESSTGPSYEKKQYDDIAKEIADTIGVQDIPIRLAPVK
jgi:hypothetical protein